VNNLPHTVTSITWVDGHLVLLAAQVGQAARHAAVLTAWLCKAQGEARYKVEQG